MWTWTNERKLITPTMVHYAFAGYRVATTWSRERGKAFADAVRLNGLSFSKFDRILPERQRTNALRRWVSSLTKPCGIMAANDIVAEW